MTDVDGLDDTGRRFLTAVYDRTDGDTSVQVSMYDVGEALDMDRTDASRAAEELIGIGLLAVKTLSGGVGLTDEGLTGAYELGCGPDGADDGRLSVLSRDRVVGEKDRLVVEEAASLLKSRLGEESWEFDALAEIVFDLRTIDCQMASPRPKTAVIRECFHSIKDVLETSGDDHGCLSTVNSLLGGVGHLQTVLNRSPFPSLFQRFDRW